MTYEELYKIGNTYECKGLRTEKWHKCEVIDVAYTKTGRIKAEVKNCSNQTFFTRARKVDVIIGKTRYENLDYEPNGVGVDTYKNLIIK
tara:strand:- start:593 stop:859 length:267 start_codon:yes stop_codon:yes gene_type:complete